MKQKVNYRKMGFTILNMILIIVLVTLMEFFRVIFESNFFFKSWNWFIWFNEIFGPGLHELVHPLKMYFSNYVVMHIMIWYVVQWSTKTGKYWNYRYWNFCMINRTETNNTKPKQMVCKPSKIAHILTFYCIFLNKQFFKFIAKF